MPFSFRRPRRHASVRTRLFLLMLAGMLPLVAAALASIYGLYREEKRAFELQVMGTARALSSVVDQELARRESLLKTLALSPTLARGDFEAFYRYAKEVAPGTDNVIVLSDLSGQQLLNTRRPFGADKLPRTSFDGLSADPGATLVSDLYFAPVGQAHSFAVRVPVWRDGQVQFHLSMGGYASQLQALLQAQKMPPAWFGSVVDRTGHIVARSRNGDAIVGRRISDGTLAALRLQPQGTLWATSREGRPILASFSRSERHGWSFIIGIPEDDVKGTLSRAVGRFGGAALLLTALALALTGWMARAIVRPVEALERAARDLEAGQPVSARDTGLQETDAALGAMESASRAILDSSRTMAQQVRDAVAQAEHAQAVVLQSQRMEAIAHLTGGIAHDFNNLLMVIGTNAYLLQRHRDGAASDKSLAAIQRSVSTGGRLTRQLLTFARRQPVAPEVLDLTERVGGIVDLVTPALSRDIVVRTETPDAPLPVLLDPGELELAVLNLALNAKAAMPGGGVLEITVRRAPPAAPGQGAQAILSVRDTGTGIPPELVPRVFEPFFTTKPPGSGTGLGLSQVFGMCEQAGGKVTLDSTLGEGTTVTLWFPVHDGTAPATPAPPAAADAPLRARVLLVEDNGDVRESTQASLQAAGAEVTSAEDVDGALQQLASGAFDVVLSDIRMPGKANGIDFAEGLRQSHPGLPVLLYSGYTDQLQRAQAMGLRVLQKPSSPDALVRALQQAIAGRAAPPA